MSETRPIRIGLMGFGRIGRQIYRSTLEDPRYHVTAISDIGAPDIMHNLLVRESPGAAKVALDGASLVSGQTRTRLLGIARPDAVPWDAFDVDAVIDASARFHTRQALQPHLDNGGGRVVITTLPSEDLDRVVLYGVNERQATAADRLVSAGSASTCAAALALATLLETCAIEQVSLTSVHAVTSDQTLQDYAGPDYRRSRSGAANIIPNETPARCWLQRLLPQLSGRLSAWALNVPVHVGSLLDLSVVLKEAVDLDTVRATFRDAALRRPDVLGVTDDPIVSSDVRRCTQSLLVDLQGTMSCGHLLKLLGWHESLGHARRVLDVVSTYHQLDGREEDR